MMKTQCSLFISLLMGLTLTAHSAEIEYGSKEITSSLEYATFKARVACITRWAPDTEGDSETSFLYFVDFEDKKTADRLSKQGYTLLNSMKKGLVCDLQNGNMKNVGVGLYSKNEEVLRAIAKEKAAVSGEVVLIRNSQLNEEIRRQRSLILKELLE